MARIFICGDTGQTALLDEAADELTKEGHDVVRGPTDEGGRLKHYSAAERAALIAPSDIAVFTTRHVCDRTMMTEAPRLRGICYPVTGVETLDLEAATELGLIVGHGAVADNAAGMAEAALMLILMLFYGVDEGRERLRVGAWRRAVPRARRLGGSTVGLIGYGRIASRLATLLSPFEARILVHSPRTPLEKLDRNASKAELADLLRNSDVVLPLTGLTAATRHMIGAPELALMRADAYLVNVGRGELVDESALVDALRRQAIAGAALDAFATEPLPLDSPLRSLDSVILTPHSVGHTVEGVAAIKPALLSNIRAIMRGDPPPICKNPDAEPAWRKRLAELGSLPTLPSLQSPDEASIQAQAIRREKQEL